MFDAQCVLHALQSKREAARFVLFGMSLCRVHMVRAATLTEEGSSMTQIIGAARRGEI